MTTPARMRPLHPAAHRVADLVQAFGLVTHGLPLPADARLTGVTLASGDVQPGDVFVAVTGFKVHGAAYAAQAVDSGAMAVLTDEAGLAHLEAAGLTGRVAVLVADDPRALAGPVAAWAHDAPGERLVTVGVTGTNGKTTTTYFLDAALRAAHATTAVLGTVELRIGEDAVESPRTTVEAPALQAILALAVEQGATALAMEVSSHALALGRVGGLTFDVVGFTNLQRDHLDFHGDMEGYFRDKSRLFAAGQARRGVVVVDDEWGRRLAAEAPIPVETVSTHAGEDLGADWAVVAADIGLDGVGSSFTLRGPDGVEHEAASPLPGMVNVSNAALAIVLAHAAGVDLDAAIAAVAVAHQIPGRMERVIERGDGFPLSIVDYAHTPDALVLALEAVRPITPGRLVIVFGSDGDRDQGKRPIMGEIAARLADVIVVTDENPRSEEPAAIRSAILDGVRSQRPDLVDVHEATSRAQAIRDALDLAAEQDTVIITGKGHEPTQEIAGVFHRYNDRDVLIAARTSRQEQHA
ncbi:UDP-N-acetylmuramoyl-L-alanyl-D-glutamate--2,6-diaminopimelate ligase [Cellulomonas sp. ICMP 17802]|uniref:UDP-N-acetylmuramoyl-L-alanyl-D-glutamate--2, 6-diaminopimelate ligase n=1 Tax=Cellulomonas sp. ICMP 17802 TaxID=3239199 RepID=UPI00351B229A